MLHRVNICCCILCIQVAPIAAYVPSKQTQRVYAMSFAEEVLMGLGTLTNTMNGSYKPLL